MIDDKLDENGASNPLMQLLSLRNVNEEYHYGKKGKNNFYLYEID